ncbi:hypothetical protein B1H29_34670 [Streptomyces pactum]|uniref:Uncharacterized protein n=1 Tax=Streptomyces pactum TaxID=68249 RepID=A0A1S6JKW7_9ACTN|nr:hypothetical protein B1H29_34670 [Streptomyces pactum]
MGGPGDTGGRGGWGHEAAPVRALREVALRAGMLGTRRGRGHPFDRCVHSVRPARPARVTSAQPS